VSSIPEVDLPVLERQLRKEGYREVYVKTDVGQAFYPSHTHQAGTTHIILQGEMFLTMARQTKLLVAGHRVDIPAGAVHSAKMGSNGCTYLVGEK
jgi:quercetin dioxygenase-like cupin family protein